METITNAASTVGTTVSNLIYGQQPAKDTDATTKSNETAGQEPISGEQGKGTAAEPFDKGNSENPTATTASSGHDDFLKLSPDVGKPTTGSPTTKTSGAGDSSIPVIPLNPDAASMGAVATNTTTTSSETGVTDKEGVTEKVWKPTALDEVKPEGAPGAGPSAPDYTPATGDASATASKSGTTDAESATSTAPTKTTSNSSGPTKESVGNDIDAILDSTPKSKHTVDDKEAEDPHSKMTGKTVRQTEASKHGEGENSKSLASEKVGTKSESSPSGEASDEKSEKKMSHLKEKLKNKLHIGSKDK